MSNAAPTPVGIVPIHGIPNIKKFVGYAPSGTTLTVSWCNDEWTPLQAETSYVVAAGATGTIATLVGGVSVIPVGATRFKAYTTQQLFYNESGNTDWSYTFAPATVNSIPANTEFEYPGVD